jgi:uncharacterized protein
MIEMKCTKCGNTTSVPETSVGQSMTCPACGNVNVVPPQSPPSGASPKVVQVSTQDSRTWAMFCHLAALSGFIGVPFGFIVGPLIIWLIKGKEHPFIDSNGKEALNFQISMCIYGIVAFILVFVFIGIILLIGLGICDIVFVIIAAVRASSGQEYRYPLTIRFIK